MLDPAWNPVWKYPSDFFENIQEQRGPRNFLHLSIATISIEHIHIVDIV